MQQSHYESLKREIETEIPESGAKVSKILDRMVEENKLLSLPEDEFNLLIAFRNWKLSPNRATGIFHYKVK